MRPATQAEHSHNEVHRTRPLVNWAIPLMVAPAIIAFPLFGFLGFLTLSIIVFVRNRRRVTAQLLRDRIALDRERAALQSSAADEATY